MSTHKAPKATGKASRALNVLLTHARANAALYGERERQSRQGVRRCQSTLERRHLEHDECLRYENSLQVHERAAARDADAAAQWQAIVDQIEDAKSQWAQPALEFAA